MSARNAGLMVGAFVAVTGLLLAPNCAQAYVGPGPGMELIPLFQSLLVWIVLAFGAALLWPVRAAIRRIRRKPEIAAPAAPELPDVKNTGTCLPGV